MRLAVLGVALAVAAPWAVAFADVPQQPGVAAPGPVVAPGAPAASAPSGPQLTLEDAVKLAMSRNERARIADANVTVADAGVARARVAFLPVVNANGQDTYRPFDKSPHNNLQATLNIQQPLIAPSAIPLYEQAKEQLAAELAQAADDKRRLAFDAARQFFDVQLQVGVLDAARHKLDTAQNDRAAAQAQFEAQLVSSNDVTRANVVLADAQREVAQDQASVDAAWLALDFVCNSNVPRALAPATALITAGQQPSGAADPLVATAQKQRTDLTAREHSAKAAHHFADEPRYRYLPTLGVAAQGIASKELQPDDHHVDASLSATLSWSIYDAGARTADARSRDAQAAIADLQTTALSRQIDSDVRTAIAQLTGAQNALVAANAAAEASRKSADETAILYHQGLAKAIELLDANDERFEAEVAAANALANVANAYLTLRLALGEEPLP